LPLVPLARMVLLFYLCSRENSYDLISRNRHSWQQRGFKIDAEGYNVDSKFPRLILKNSGNFTRVKNLTFFPFKGTLFEIGSFGEQLDP
jgi:hypothetical protein